ncbi:uncharacterized protein [Primulina eburnea]|uniref:uncharacterized protein n=1 Tax=Primulina eburnea TaxID=1245227 RepID=UPI003C6CA22A
MDIADKSWMYRRLENGFLSSEFCVGVETFVSFALSNPDCLLDGKLRCPCNRTKCRNKCFEDAETVKFHLGRYGFVPNYYCWEFHGDRYVPPMFPNFNMEAPSSSTTATLYRGTIHGWRTGDHHPQTVTPERWDAWTTALQQQDWQDRAVKNKANRNIELAGEDTGTTKQIAGAKTYNVHGKDLEEMEPYMAESMTPADDGSEPAVPSPQSVNSMFKTVVGGKKKGRIYEYGSMFGILYPDEMASGRRGGSLGVSQSSQSEQMADMRQALDSSLRRHNELCERMQATEAENALLRDRMASLEEQVRVLVAGMSQGATAHTSDRTLLGPDTSHMGRSRGAAVASSSCIHRLSQSYVPPTQEYEDGDDDDDETQSP